MSKKVAKLFFVCESCEHKEEPSFSIIKSIEEDEANVSEFPFHCNKKMRITILEVDQGKKVATIDTESLKRTVVQMLKLYLNRTAGDETIVELFEKKYYAMINEKVAGLENDKFTIAEVMKILVQPVLESLPELQEEIKSIKPLLIHPIDIAIESARGRMDDTHGLVKQDYLMPMREDVEVMDINSVGIDCGSSTTHLIFSTLKLQRETGFLNLSRRFNVVERKILYEGEIIDTPLIDADTIDIKRVVDFLKNEYIKAGFKVEDIDTGAVIVTGETAKKGNASEIVNLLSDEAGKFVSATAGPNFESLLAALGSGATDKSQSKQNTILSVDIGGGTSNLAISSKGQIISTSCINVGGRLLGIDDEFRIWRIEEPTKLVMREIGLKYEIGDIISKVDVEQICQIYIDSLLEVMQGRAESKIAQALMMTENLDITIPIDEIIFCGGVSEFIYGETNLFNDIGSYIADGLKKHDFGIPVIEPKSKIRATVIGAGSYSLAISGSTCYYDNRIKLPLLNIPVLAIDGNLAGDEQGLNNCIRSAFQKFDLIEGEDTVALYFSDFPLIIPGIEIEQKGLTMLEYRDKGFRQFAKNIETSLSNSIKNKLPILLLYKADMAGMIGRFFTNDTSIQENYMFIDELDLSEGDFIDIGTPLTKQHSFPVTVKSLVFN
ncbi:MAG: ethanolamine ammonia-lyase reactivating factor EutA [Candidatus Kariarchaeaceae archaeon]